MDSVKDDHGIRIELVEQFSQLARVDARWNALLQRSRADCVFLTWEWIEAWWGVYGERFELKALLAWRGQELVGIAPIMVGRHPRYGVASPRVLMMIGQGGDTLAERFDFIIEPSLEEPVAGGFVDYWLGPMRADWDMILFERVADTSPNKRRIIEMLGRAGLKVETPAEQQVAYARLPRTMDEYLAGRSSNFRAQYRGSCRKVERLGATRLLRAGEDIDVRRAMDVLADLHRRRFEGEANASFSSVEYVSFHHRVAQVFLERGWLWLVILELDGKPIAARYDYVYGDKIWCMQGGWDPSFGAARPGMVLTGEVIRWGTEQGLAEYDFLCGEEDYKKRWATGERRLTGLVSFNTRTLVGRFSRSVRDLKRSVRAIYRPMIEAGLRRPVVRLGFGACARR